jgi:hypothetical protein
MVANSVFGYSEILYAGTTTAFANYIGIAQQDANGAGTMTAADVLLLQHYSPW